MNWFSKNTYFMDTINLYNGGGYSVMNGCAKLIQAHLVMVLSFLMLPVLTAEVATDQIDEGGQVHGRQDSMGISLTDQWLEPWQHHRFSPRATPYVHTFNLEPALLERDLSFNMEYINGYDDEEAFALETELEWAFTRRIGMVVEIPYITLNSSHGENESGQADILLGPRLLTVETDAFILSSNFEFSVPSGKDEPEFGSGEYLLHPSLSLWADLGNWFTVGGQVGLVYGVHSGDSSFRYRTALTYSFLTMGSRHTMRGHSFPDGLSSLIVELNGKANTERSEQGLHTAELIIGASYNIHKHWEMRGGYQIPTGGPQEFDKAFILSMIYHF